MSAPALRLASVSEADLASLREFEGRNRAYFEAHINARDPDFYTEAGLRQAIATHAADARADRAYAYLVWEGERLVARVNLTRVRRQHFHSAELGYRVAQAETGRGVARAAVGLAVQQARETLGLFRLEAAAHAENPASAAVLARNGFRLYGRTLRSFELAGRWIDTLHFERDLQD